jgi:hypothetical protein
MSRASRYLPALLLLSGALIATPACASGQYIYRGDRPYGGYGYGREIERRAYDNGFREGVRAGEKDGRRGRSYEYDRHDEWRDADDGYHREYGPREYYRRSFREGFRAGYAQGYNRYARYPGWRR